MICADHFNIKRSHNLCCQWKSVQVRAICSSFRRQTKFKSQFIGNIVAAYRDHHKIAIKPTGRIKTYKTRIKSECTEIALRSHRHWVKLWFIRSVTCVLSIRYATYQNIWLGKGKGKASNKQANHWIASYVICRYLKLSNILKNIFNGMSVLVASTV